MRLYVFGNSHVWTLFDWNAVAGRDSAILRSSAGDVELVGMAVTGATAHNLGEDGSSTQAGPKLREMLDADPDPEKSLLVVFGEVDCSTHVGHHGVGDGSAIVGTWGRYEQALRDIDSRPDVRHMLVASTIPHHANFRPAMRAEIAAISIVWNSEVRSMCGRLGWTYVDLYDRFLGPDGVYARKGLDEGAEQNHLHQDERAGMVEAVLEALPRALASADAFTPPVEIMATDLPENDQ